MEYNKSEVVLNAVVNVVGKSWSGTMTDLSKALSKSMPKKDRDMLPGSPSALRITLNGLVNKLKKRNVKVMFTRTSDANRTRLASFTSK